MTWYEIANLKGTPGDAAALAILAKMPQRRGLLPTGANANTYRLYEHYGVWQVVSTGGYLNMPPIPTAGTFEVIPASEGLSVTQRLTHQDGFLWREAYDASQNVWGPWHEAAKAAEVPLPQKTQMLLNLAQSDGWHALYDPSNPKTRSLSAGKVASIGDALGNLPPALTDVESSMPAWDPAAFSGLGAARYGSGGSTNALRTPEFSQALAQPTFIMTLARSNVANAGTAGRVILDGATNAGRQAILASATFPNRWAMYAGNEFAAEGAMDTSTHVFGAQFAGAYSLTGSRFFLDGTPQPGSFGGTANDRPLSGLTIGNHQAGGTTRGWDGHIGPILIYKGIPSDEVRERMTRLLQAVSSSAGRSIGDKLVSKEAVLMRQDGTLDFEKKPDTLEIPASLTKMLTAYLARQTITNARLDEVITLSVDDELSGSTPQLKVGDKVKYRDLLYLAMLPSHNVAAELLASHVGAQLPGTGPGRDRFIAAMNGLCSTWGWTGAVFTTASGLGTSNKATARQMGELLWRISNEDATLLGIMGELTHVISISGSDPRDVTAVHSIPVNGNPAFPEFVAGKTGTLNNIVGNVAMMVTHGGVRKVVVTMGALPVNARYPDARMILDGTATVSVSRGPVLTETTNEILQLLENPTSRVRVALDKLYVLRD